MQGVEWKGGGGAYARYWNSCARGLFYFYQELLHPESIAWNLWIAYKLVDTDCFVPGCDAG
ncbi:MAG: hypothetical protein F6K62_11515 [Sphaerospermopsis sp. SIO1G2]|nr:hypothetical protein [Sphaerospermopsis sp. SIO1G2]